ncbi:MAG: hypothetical protein U0401_21710 [Anaerolineae bacterium]
MNLTELTKMYDSTCIAQIVTGGAGFWRRDCLRFGGLQSQRGVGDRSPEMAQ